MASNFLDTKSQHRKDNYKGMILIDMDNTIVDYSASIAPKLQELYPDIKITSENWQTLQLNDLHFHRRNIQSQPGFFKSMKPMNGALVALKEMKECGYYVLIVSSPSVNGGTCHSEKSEWIKEHLGEKWARRLILTKDKTVVHGDVLIDDKPSVHGLVDPEWQHILFAQPYNVHLEKDGRVLLHEWKDWKKVVEPCLIKATK